MSSERLARLKAWWKLFTTKYVDQKTTVLLGEAVARAQAQGHRDLCVFYSHAADAELLQQTLETPGVASTGTKDKAFGTDLPGALAVDGRIGRYWEPGHIRLPRGARTVYFVGPWRLVTSAMLRYLLDRAELDQFFCRVSGRWRSIPLAKLRAVRAIARPLGLLWLYKVAANGVWAIRNSKAAFRQVKLFKNSLFIRHLDNAPAILRDSALVHADARGASDICVFFSHQEEAEQLRIALATPGIGSVGTKDTLLPSTLPDELANSDRVGRYFHHGVWMLPRVNRANVYFVGPWRLLTLDIIREAMRADVQSLHVRVGTTWRGVPLKLLRAARPLLRQLARVAIRARGASAWVRHAIARCVMLLLPSRSALAARIAGPGGLAGGSLESILQIMVRSRDNTYEPVGGRVVLVCGNLSPGGAERQVSYSIQGLAQRKLESVTLLCHQLTPGTSRKYDFYLSLVQETGATVREIIPRASASAPETMPPVMRELLAALPASLASDIANLYWEFLELKPEVVHAWLDWDNVRAGLAAAMAGVPKILVSGRNINPSHYQLYQPYMDPAYRVLAKLPNVTILNNSRAGGDDYADWIGIRRDRVRVIYNAIDFGDRQRTSNEAVATQRNALGIPTEAFVVGGVFRFEDEKRPLLWIKAAAEIAQRVPNAHFVLFGHGSLAAAMQLEADRLGLSDRLILAGVTSDVMGAMSLMDVMMLVSYGEGLPNVVLEAQWVGTAVVCTDVGGAAEAINPGVTGWAIKTDDPAVLAEKVIMLNADPEALMRARREGPAFVRQTFNRKRLVDETLAAYGLLSSADHPER